MANAFIKVPPSARRGEVITVKILIRHRMESGHRRDRVGKLIPRNIIHSFRARYAGREVFKMELGPGIAANPFIEFRTVATTTGELVCEWTDDAGVHYSKSAAINVS